MNESDARRVWLIRAFEAPLTPPWTDADAVWATDEARRKLGAQASVSDWVGRRAQVAIDRLGGRSMALRTALAHAVAPATHGLWWVTGVAIAGFAAGLAVDALGNRGRVDLLSLPLIGLLGWNLLVYLGLLLGSLRRIRTAADARTRGLRSMAESALRWVATKRDDIDVHALRHGREPEDEAPAWRPALTRFRAGWNELTRPVWRARAAAALHLAAAGLAAGAFAGLYLRGLVLEYRASWDSTFLTASQALSLLQALLGPASQLTGVPLPTAPAFEALRGSSGGSENAARWIHLWSATLGMVIVLPRVALALASLARARSAARRPALPWTEDPWLIRLAAQHRAGPMRIVVIPYRIQTEASRRDPLRRLVSRSLGSEPLIAWTPPAAEADDPPAIEPAPGEEPTPALIVLMSARQTPERETHGRFLHALQAIAPAHRSAPLLLVDESGFGERLTRADAATRLRERRSAWQGLADELGVAALFVDLGADREAPPPDASTRDALARHLMAASPARP